MSRQGWEREDVERAKRLARSMVEATWKLPEPVRERMVERVTEVVLEDAVPNRVVRELVEALLAMHRYALVDPDYLGSPQEAANRAALDAARPYLGEETHGV